MADTPWGSFTDRAYLNDSDVLLVEVAGGGGVNVPGSAIIKKDSAGNVIVGATGGAITLLHVNKPMTTSIAGAVPAGAFLVSDMSGTALSLDIGLGSGTGSFIQSRAFNAASYYQLLLNPAGGNLLVNTESAFYSGHTINRSTAAGNAILTVASATTGMQSAVFLAVSAHGWNTADAALWLGKQANGRSLNAGGSINGAGADPAEYWRRALSCGTILAGQICGINAANELTTDWADAVRFGVKSGLINQPFIVGNDVYAKVYEETAGPAPVAPEAIAPAPVEPVAPAPFTAPEPVQGEGEDTVAFAVRLVKWSQLAQEAAAALTAYMAAASTYPAQLADWTALNATYQAALSVFEAADAVWRAGLEAERQRWDRISIGGQVYIRTEQPCSAGDYVIPAQVGDGIGFAFVPGAEITFDQYRRKVGVVLTTDGEWPLIEVIRS